MEQNSGNYVQQLAGLRGGWKPQDFSKRWLVTADRICVASDVHIPYHDEQLLAQMLEHCQKEGIEAIVWLGDLLDMPTFSSWGQTDHTTKFTRELDIARGVISMSAKVVEKQYWSRGNHEERWMRKLDNQTHMEQLAYMCGLGPLVEDGRLILSDNPSLDAFDGDWLLTHPKAYGRIPLDVPVQLARRYQQNVMSGHAHHWGMAAFERFMVVETGGLFAPNLHQYIQYSPRPGRDWAQGYWFLIDGEPTGYRNRGGHK
jgi:predicted phosphodiesterase